MSYQLPTISYANRLNVPKPTGPNSRKVLEIRSITLFRSLSAVALAKADAFCASLWLKNMFTPLETCFCFLMGFNPWLINDLHPCKALYNCRETFTDVMSALQIKLFLQNKAKFRKSQMNVTKVLTKDYGNRTLGEHGKKQSQTNPNKAKQSQLKPIKYKNKAKTNPIKPNFKGANTH